jgi:membrane-anchored mycosin MYCP
VAVAAKRRSRTGLQWCLVGALTVVLLGGAGRVLAAPVASNPQYVKYYVVTDSYQGQPENLPEIAGRFLGTVDRTGEVLTLNAGRSQPDGRELTDPQVLRTGWQIVLPWDAAGPGLRYGLLPGATPGGSSAGARPTTKPAAPPGRRTAPAPGAVPPTSRPGSGAPARRGCAAASAGEERSGWAQRLAAADGAWNVTKGDGVMVAVVDSGVDGGVPQLAGRVVRGADVTAGTGRGNADCLGSGTGMAGIIAAAGGGDGAPIGLATQATILPVRVVTTAPGAKATDAATAVEVAVSAGAKVIALGSYVDLAAPPVAAAVGAAVGHDVLVVVGAPTADRPGAATGPPADALLRAGGVDEDRQPAEPYRAGAVDVLAPGIGVTSLGPGKSGVRAVSGTQYAVAFVAGVAALVRSAYPNLTAPQVAHRIKVTSAPPGGASTGDGTGMVSAETAVTRALPEEHRHLRAGAGKCGAAGAVARAALVGVVLVGLAAVAVLARRARRARATLAGAGYPATGEPPDPPGFADHVGDPPDLIDHLGDAPDLHVGGPPDLVDHLGGPRGDEDG